MGDEEVDMVLHDAGNDTLDFEPEEETVITVEEKDEIEIIYETKNYSVNNLCQAMNKIDIGTSSKRECCLSNSALQFTKGSAKHHMFGKYTPNQNNATETHREKRDNANTLPALQLLKKPFFIRSFPTEPFPNRPNWNRNQRSKYKLCKNPLYVKTNPYKPPSKELKEIQEIGSPNKRKGNIVRTKNERLHTINCTKKRRQHSYNLNDTCVSLYNTFETPSTSFSSCKSINVSVTSESIGMVSKHVKKFVQIKNQKKNIFQKNLQIIAISENDSERIKTSIFPKKVCSEKTDRSFTLKEAKRIVKDIHAISNKKLTPRSSSSEGKRKVLSSKMLVV